MKREPLTVQVRALTAWFDIHHNDPTVPQEYFRQQLRFNKNILGPKPETQIQDSGIVYLHNGRYRLAHGNSHSSIWPAFNVGKYTVMEAVQNVVKGLYELRNEPKFSETLSEVN